MGDFQDVLDKAAKTRRREVAYARKAAQDTIFKKISRWWNKKRPIDPESFRVYWLLSPKRAFTILDFSFLLALVCLAVSLIYTPKEGRSLFTSISAIAAGTLGVLLFIKYVRVILGYSSYRGWRLSIPFAIHGWDEFFLLEHALSPYHWRVDAKIHLDLTPSAVERKEVIDAMTYIFRKEANGWFYSTEDSVAGFSGDPRKEWTRVGNELYGSLNIRILGEARELLLRLGELAKKDPVITGVRFSYGTSVANVDPPSYTPNAT